MKKKFLCIIAALALLLIFPLSGCGGSDDTAEIEATVNGFMTAMQEGDLEGMKEYADPAIFEENGSLSEFSTIENMDEELAEAVGVDVSALSDTTKDAVNKYVNKMLQNLVTAYEITEVTETDDGIGKVKVTTTYGFDPEKGDEIDVNDEIEAMTTEYMTENMSELTQIYSTGGQEALMSKVLDDMAGQILDLYADAIMQTGEVTQDSVFTVENKDGKWLITAEDALE